MAHLFFILITAACLQRAHLQASPDFQAHVPVEVVWAEKGGEAELPCNVAPTAANDSVNMVLWFKDSTGIPLYSFDARGKPLQDGIHSALSSDLGRRSYFVTGPPARLRVTQVTTKDEGIFRCRVDFFNSPTQNHRVNLTLIVPPSEPQILNPDGTEVRDMAGPYLEGDGIHLTCIVTGGEPSPDVTWWMGDNLVDAISENSEGGRVINRLEISPVTRHLQATVLHCQAQSAKATTAVAKTVILELYLKPLTVKIVSGNEVMSAGKSKLLMCETEGSIPPANISWLLEGEPIRQAATMVGIGVNRTTSTLTLRPDWEDDGKLLSCRATNPKYPDSYIEDKRHLKIAYAPIVTARIRSEYASNLVEGNSVTLICEIKSSPSPDSVVWYHGGELASRTNMMTEFTIDSLKRHHSGQYSCFARNREGATRSKPVTLVVRYAPVCKEGSESSHVGVILGETTDVKCEVEAEPAGVELKFSWTFNGSLGDVNAVPTTCVRSMDRVCHLSYAPVSDSDLGTLACWASNTVGRQLKPCLVHLIKARYPSGPEGCHVERTESNPDLVHLEVICRDGGNGGPNHYFVLELMEGFGIGNDLSVMGDEGPGDVSLPVLQLLSQEPRFFLRDVRNDRQYRLKIFAKNDVGESRPPVIIPIDLPNSMEKLTGTGLNNPKSSPEPIDEHWLMVAIAGTAVTIATLIIICVVIAVILTKSKKEKVRSVPLNNLGPSVRIRYPGSSEDTPPDDFQ